MNLQHHSEGSDADAEALRPVSRGFIGLYTVAEIGAYVSFVPLLQILVPLQAASIDPPHAAALLSRVALCGAIVASLANILFGALSDRTSAARGRRRPWLLAGLAATLASYAVIWDAGTATGLLLSVICFQIAFNALFAPLGAVLADYVPDRQKGVVSALLGLGYPLGSLIGTAAVGAWLVDGTTRFLLLGVLVAGSIAPFAWRLGDPAIPARPLPAEWHRTWWVDPRAYPDFARAWVGRLLVATAFSVMQGYMLLYLHSLTAVPSMIPGRPEAALARLAAIATVANIGAGLLGGWLSDRMRRRKPFVFAGGAGMAAGIVCTALAPDWAALQLATLIYGIGAGIYYAVDLALIVQVLPSLQSAGKDLGIVNLSNTLPQIIAPLVALHLVGGIAPDYRTLFLLAAGAALLGAACVLRIKGAR